MTSPRPATARPLWRSAGNPHRVVGAEHRHTDASRMREVRVAIPASTVSGDDRSTRCVVSHRSRIHRRRARRASTASSTTRRIAAAYDRANPESSSGTSPKVSRPNQDQTWMRSFAGSSCTRGDHSRPRRLDRAGASLAGQVHDVVLQVTQTCRPSWSLHYRSRAVPAPSGDRTIGRVNCVPIRLTCQSEAGR
jgi:hypothetical protein